MQNFQTRVDCLACQFFSLDRQLWYSAGPTWAKFAFQFWGWPLGSLILCLNNEKVVAI